MSYALAAMKIINPNFEKLAGKLGIQEGGQKAEVDANDVHSTKTLKRVKKNCRSRPNKRGGWMSGYR